MNQRQESGKNLAASGRCAINGRIVTVPSRTRTGQVYLVNMRHARDARCGCPDAVVNRHICAHIWAARVLLEALPADAGGIAKAQDPPKTYPRAWAAYNHAEVNAPAIARLVMEYLAANLSTIADKAV
jgi:hypothetical protein